MMIPGKNGQMEEQIDFSKTTEICCENCGGKTFKQTLLMRKMSAEGFKVEKRNKRQIITHMDSKIFNDWGFISEEPPYQQLTLILEEEVL